MSKFVCGITSCDARTSDFTPCCHEPVCDNHYILYPLCTQSHCENSTVVMCQTCIEYNVYQCACKMTLCNKCNSEEFWDTRKCNCNPVSPLPSLQIINTPSSMMLPPPSTQVSLEIHRINNKLRNPESGRLITRGGAKHKELIARGIII